MKIYTDGLVNRLASNMVILNQAHRVAWLIGVAFNLKEVAFNLSFEYFKYMG